MLRDTPKRRLRACTTDAQVPHSRSMPSAASPTDSLWVPRTRRLGISEMRAAQ